MVIISRKTWISECFLLLLFLFLKINFSKGSDTIFPGESLSGNQTLASAGGIFELGFFTPGNSGNHFIGIWYKQLPEKPVIWVANRKQPVSNPFSVLKPLEDGNIVLLNQTGDVIWSTNSTSKVQNSTTAKLLDNGNFVVRNTLESSTVIWQSFDHPTDHWLPEGKFGYNKLTNEKQNLVSWRSPENPAPSLFSAEVEQNRTNNLLLWNGSEVYRNSGEWTETIFTLVPEIQSNPYVTNVTYVSNGNESYFTYASAIPNAFTRFVLDATGQYKQYVWQKNFGEWRLLWTRPTQQCEVYAFCGPFGICNQQRQRLCVCIHGFEPKMQKNWELGYHTDGCEKSSFTM
ncbi:G-type lectin S-receptor-like serine/threonine-protein kinase [Melia azedarach]|uniref:G-type lectin S-receptor-like serine/threonine-protein kinase n=1 Tax=Melia azedarach TaxID=155640 RepID=A0ACC1Z220_MELAZ|nr:G-type lectin S-receptor-like serine/threonine-protein kinase [Melia azedarach]